MWVEHPCRGSTGARATCRGSTDSHVIRDVRREIQDGRTSEPKHVLARFYCVRMHVFYERDESEKLAFRSCACAPSSPTLSTLSYCVYTKVMFGKAKKYFSYQ